MNTGGSFVCGFYGARDGYEVPAALHEAGMLEVLLTDAYGSGGLLASGGLVRAVRENADLPRSKVRSSLFLAVVKQACGRMFSDPERRNLRPDALLSRALGRMARRRHAHIFTYEPYAVPRPRGGFPDGRRQVVFFYHPHVDAEDAIYDSDRLRFPEAHAGAVGSASPWRRRTADAWRYADLVLCASTFTKQTLLAAGLTAERCVVVPYGTRPVAGARMERHGGLKLLFVGRNPLRKGLHHVLAAWAESRKGPNDHLTVVCRERPEAIRRMTEGLADVRWRADVTPEELARLYEESDALVVPSLCEGFGHVYLEAMSRGCAVVGTPNSALPDIGGEDAGVFVCQPGNVGALTTLISTAASAPELFRRCSAAAAERAAAFTWGRFRAGVVGAARGICR